MDDWQKDISQMLETFTDQVENFLLDVARDVTDAMNSFVEFSEDLSAEFNVAMVDEVEQYLTQMVSPVLEAYFGVGSAIGDVTQPVVQTVEPLLKQHPTCVGCRHFHGQFYGDALLVCGMHPYGVEEGVETCPDKEAVNWGVFSSTNFGFDEDWL